GATARVAGGIRHDEAGGLPDRGRMVVLGEPERHVGPVLFIRSGRPARIVEPRSRRELGEGYRQVAVTAGDRQRLGGPGGMWAGCGVRHRELSRADPPAGTVTSVNPQAHRPTASGKGRQLPALPQLRGTSLAPLGAEAEVTRFGGATLLV